MTVKNEELLEAIINLTKQHQDAFTSMDSRVVLIENGILTLHKDLSKIGTKVDDLVEQSISSTKDIDYLKENLNKLEKSMKEGFDAVWNEGIRSLQHTQETALKALKNAQDDVVKQMKENILSTVMDKIEKRALHERLIIYGTAIATIFAVVKVLK